MLAWALIGPGPAAAEITEARYAEPTGRYPHGVLGDTEEFGALILRDSQVGRVTFRLPELLVFEDVAPRLADVTGDGVPEAVVVESHQQQGARLAIYDATGRIAATPFIGTRFRWLAPVGVGDLDGDGKIELAYVDRPHLAKTLRIWRFSDGGLTQIANASGHTNHRIGERDIAGGLRDCGAGPEMITASANWSQLLSTRLSGNTLTTTPIGTATTRAAFARALECR